jgi:hypothetical protein
MDSKMTISLLTYLCMIAARDGQNLNVFGPERDDLTNKIHGTHPSLHLDGIDPKRKRVHVYFDGISDPYLGTKKLNNAISISMMSSTSAQRKFVFSKQPRNQPLSQPRSQPSNQARNQCRGQPDHQL